MQYIFCSVNPQMNIFYKGKRISPNLMKKCARLKYRGLVRLRQKGLHSVMALGADKRKNSKETEARHSCGSTNVS